jgi:O-antigen/teichoic acid export membrane protein
MGILGRRYLHTLLSNLVLKFVVGLAIGILTTRPFGPEGRGEYSLIVLIITTVTTLFNFGVPSTNTYFAAKKELSKVQLYRASIILAVIFSIVTFCVLSLLYEFKLFDRFLFPTDKLTPPILASLGIIPIVFFNLFAQGIIIGENKIELNNYMSLSTQGALAFLLAVLYLFGALSVTAAILVYAFSHVLAFAIIVVTSFPSFSDVVRTRIVWRDYSAMLRFSGTIHLGNLTQFFNYRLDSFIVKFFRGTAAVGLYGIAAILGETLWLLSGSMAFVLLPTIAGQHEKSKEIAVKAAAATFAISILGGIVAFLLGPFLIVLLFGEKFSGSIEPFLILIPGVVVFSITNILATYLTGAGRPGYNAAIAFISFLFTVIFDIVLIPRYSISGAAIASGISYTLSTIMTVIAFARVSDISFSESISIVRSMSTDVRSIVSRARQRLGLRDNQSGSTGTK